MINQNQSVAVYTKPKRKIFKIVLLSVLVILLGVGVWVGATAYNAIKKITSLSGGSGSVLNFLNDNRQELKGESDGRTNILLLGMGGKNHPGGMLTDSMMVFSVDWKTKKAAMITIPRDLWVQIPGYGYSKINGAYAHGEQNAKVTGGGGQVASDTVSKVLGIPIHYSISVDFEGFKKTVDTVGGIDVYVDKDLYDPLYPAANMIDYDPFKITAGEHHLDGATALKYARSRETTSDFDRSKRQQKVIAGIKEKVITLNVLANPKKVTELLNILGDHLKTNMSITEIKSLWEGIKEIDISNMTTKVLDTAADGPLTSTQDERGYIIIPKKGIGNFTDLQKIAENIFKTETQSKTTNDYKIEVLNGSTKAGQASEAADLLETKGYNVTKIGDATKTYPITTVYNCGGQAVLETAQAIATLLSGEVKAKTACTNIDIQVNIGQNSIK